MQEEYMSLYRERTFKRHLEDWFNKINANCLGEKLQIHIIFG